MDSVLGVVLLPVALEVTVPDPYIEEARTCPGVWVRIRRLRLGLGSRLANKVKCEEFL